jgi:hypothetical protein
VWGGDESGWLYWFSAGAIGVASSIIGAVRGHIAKRFTEPVLTWAGKKARPMWLRVFPGRLHPAATPEVQPSEAQPPEPLPKVARKRKPATKPTKTKVIIPVFYQGGSFRSQPEDFEIEWGWDDDLVTDVRLLCPRCGMALQRGFDNLIACSRDYTLLHCSRCGFTASAGAPENQFSGLLRQEAYGP